MGCVKCSLSGFKGINEFSQSIYSLFLHVPSVIFKHPVDPFWKYQIALKNTQKAGCQAVLCELFNLFYISFAESWSCVCVCVCHFSLFTRCLVFLSSIQKERLKLLNASLSFIPTPASKSTVSCSSLPVWHVLLSLSQCLSIYSFGIFGFPLDCGYRAQLSADAGQRRPSQKEKYVRRRDYLSPLCHHTPGTPPFPRPSTPLSFWIGWKCLRGCIFA